MRIQLLPSPVMQAPIPLRYLQSHTISGSRAQFFSTVSPSDRTDNSTACSVAPTLFFGKTTVPPAGLKRRAVIPFSFSCTDTPRHLNAKTWISTGLFPITHPPGYPTVPLPLLPSIAPRRITEERIRPVLSPQISVPSARVQSR